MSKLRRDKQINKKKTFSNVNSVTIEYIVMILFKIYKSLPATKKCFIFSIIWVERVLWQNIKLSVTVCLMF